MKICIAQIKPVNGNILANIGKHWMFIKTAVRLSADAIFFPELSITGYEPKLAEMLAFNHDDNMFDQFQILSNESNVTICIGMPTRAALGTRISMLCLQPNLSRQIYSKQFLHPDELQFFKPGEKQIVLSVRDKKIAPAICYESLLSVHSSHANTLGVDLYVACVAKSQQGVAKAFEHYPKVAQKFSIPVLMVNCVGECDDFTSVGKSSVWKKNGQLISQLDDKNEGLIVFDTETEACIIDQ